MSPFGYFVNLCDRFVSFWLFPISSGLFVNMLHNFDISSVAPIPLKTVLHFC